MTYRFHPEAEAELLDTVAYYEARKAGLGARYLAKFEQVLQQVCTARIATGSIITRMSDEYECSDFLSPFSTDSSFGIR